MDKGQKGMGWKRDEMGWIRDGIEQDRLVEFEQEMEQDGMGRSFTMDVLESFCVGT